jgi:Tol biopolymer transport system component
MAPRVVALVAVGLLAGCAGIDFGSDTPTLGSPSAAPDQPFARLAAVRIQAVGTPRFALITFRDDGLNRQVVVEAPAEAFERPFLPVWSPDAAQLYFIGLLRERQGDRFVYYESDVFAVDARRGQPRRVTRSRDVGMAVPSPDGKTLLVMRDEHPGKRPFTSGLWLLDADGRNARRLLDTEEGQLDRDGAWSPDGRTIAFTRCRSVMPDSRSSIENTCAVYSVSADGSGLRRLAERASQPAFSPDGRLIAFVSDRDENGERTAGEDEVVFANELYVMNADGGNERRLTRSESLDEAAPAWSPDGSRIAYSREGPARFMKELMVVNADGTCPTQLVGDASDESLVAPSFDSPAWRPGRLSGAFSPLDCV